ncbi:hypothetical protein M407DRAFT_219639 [Tulasnella calospora MUT 4182]|uniref:Uncharacterized protein n=1 Tax=Tulasnella calospora MUT 4182 TaxID=1051891 RepID=A0A0C3Q8X7_9AGAM|nr:hypothetical protein M407DRAFT_219639 [Tulasnella calospora MUT 4182]
MGPNDQTELGTGESVPIFLNCLAELSQLRELSIKCLGAKLTAEILVAASKLPHLRALELNNLSFIGTDCDHLQFSMMEALREFPDSSSNTDGYSFLQFLEGQPLVSFQEMRELRLPQPVAAVDVDRGIDFLRRCSGLQALAFESKRFSGTWGTHINELGPRLPWECLNQLRIIHGPAGLVSAIAPGRPIQKAMIRFQRQTDFSLLSALEALRQSTVPVEALAIWTYNWRETSLSEIVQLFPQLQSLAIGVLSVPAMWDGVAEAKYSFSQRSPHVPDWVTASRLPLFTEEGYSKYESRALAERGLFRLGLGQVPVAENRLPDLALEHPWFMHILFARNSIQAKTMVSAGGSFFRLPNVKGLRRRKENELVEVATAVQARLPQEILNEIIGEYHTSFPEQPLYPLLTSRSLYEATIPCLYRSIVFTIKQDRRDRWLSLLTSLRKHGSLVRSLDLTEPMGPNDRTELGTGDLMHHFLDRLAQLSQLRELSIKCLGAKLPVEILVTASYLPHLRALELNHLSLIGANCDSMQFSVMEGLRAVRLINVHEHDGSLKWSTFIPLTLNQSTQHFEYFKPLGSSDGADSYCFLQFLEGQPRFSFPEMRELRLPRPATAVDVDRGIDLLRRCPSLQALGFESKGFSGPWGTQINELGPKIPWSCLNQLRIINGPPGLVSAVAPGRPIQRAMIRYIRVLPTTFRSDTNEVQLWTMVSAGGSFFRLPNVKGLRRRKENELVEVATAVQARLPQEILNEIIGEYHTSFPEQPLYPLLTSRSLYEATIPCLYRSIVFTIKQDRRDRWLSLLTSLRKHGSLVRSLDLTEPMGPNDRTELGTGDLMHHFLDRLAQLSQLRELSIKCLGAKLPVEILVTASYLPHLRALELNHLSLIGANCDSMQFSVMEGLRAVRLINVHEHDGSLKWSTFIPLTLNQSTQHFEYFKPLGSSDGADSYCFLQFLEGQPRFSFPEMRELRLPRPATAVDVDRGIDLLRRCPSLQALGFESKGFSGPWGTQINELGPKIPWSCLNQLRIINGPPGLVSAAAPGRPIQRAMIRLDRQTDIPLLSTLAALRQSTAPIEGLAIWTSNWRETSLEEIVQLFPRLQSLAICVTIGDWKLEPLFALDRLEKLCLIRVDGHGGITPRRLTIERRAATGLFEAIPSLHTLWFNVLSDKWTREGTYNPSSSKTIGKRIRGLLGVSAWR